MAAAVNPADGPWLYYVTVNPNTGETKFTDDYDEFLGFKARAVEVARRQPPVSMSATSTSGGARAPVGHSLSPVLHRAAYTQLGLDWSYEAVDVDEVGLAGFLDGLRAGLGGAVADDAPEARGAAAAGHCQRAGVGGRWCEHRRPRWSRGRVGHNTDVLGMVEALRGIGAQPGPAVVLGGGATAASALAALAELGCPGVVVHARRPEATAGLSTVAERLGLRSGGPGVARSAAGSPAGVDRGVDGPRVRRCEPGGRVPASPGGSWMSRTRRGRPPWSLRGMAGGAAPSPATRCCCTRPSSRSGS